MARAKSKRPRRSRLGRVVRRVLLGAFLLAGISAAAAAALLYWEIAQALPPVDQLAQYRPPITTQVLADDGSVIGEFYLEKRYLVPIERIPTVVRHAFLAAEDEHFYRHGGIDLAGIARAFVNNFVAGGRLQGGSTITQQVVKALLLDPRRSYERKLKEVVLALRIERQLAKDEILALYLNHIYLGSGAYGVAAASQAYFGKPLDELTLAEAAMLAGLPQAPSRYSPLKHWRRAKSRQSYVLRRMLEARFISTAEYDAAVNQPLALAPRTGNYLAAPFYVEHVRRLLEKRYGAEAPYKLGLKVHTAANAAMTAAAENALRAGLEELDGRQGGNRVPVRRLSAAAVPGFLKGQESADAERPLVPGAAVEAVVESVRRGVAHLRTGAGSGTLELPSNGAHPVRIEKGDVFRVVVAQADAGGTFRFQLDPQPVVQGALLAIEPETGHVKAMVGGYDFNRSHFNRAVQAARQPGSAFKPLLYAAALDRGYTPASIIVDAPIAFPDNKGVWAPRNFEDKYFGPTTLREALTFSRNVVTVKLTNSLGLSYVTGYLRRLGISSPLAANLSLALGAAEVSLLELAGAYGVFANRGRLAEPVFITRIVDNGGKTIFASQPRVREAIPESTAYQITSMLQGVIERGTGRRARELGRPAAGKTGTTNDLNDAWFVGYTPQLLAGVWVGFDEKRSLGPLETGGRVAAPIWARFMEGALESRPIADFEVPASIAFVPIDPATGERTGPGSPTAILEAFRRGSEPPFAATATDTGDTGGYAAPEYRYDTD